MHCVVRHVEEERLARRHRISDACIGLNGQRLGKKRFRAVVLLQVRNGAFGSPCTKAVVLLAVIAAGCSKGGTANVDIEAKVLWLGPCKRPRSEVALADVDRAIARFLQQPRQRHVALGQSSPIPLGWAQGTAIVLVGIDPVGRVMTCGVLSGHNGNASR